MRRWKAKKIVYDGDVYYDVASTARLLGTTAARVQQLMGIRELIWTQRGVNGKLLISASSIVDYEKRQSKRSL